MALLWGTMKLYQLANIVKWLEELEEWEWMIRVRGENNKLTSKLTLSF